MGNEASHRRTPAVRQFETGATRDLDTGKPDYEGYLSPAVIKAFGQYMTAHRVQRDGTLRASDNWQKGIPQDVYMKSMWRHFHDLWMIHRGQAATDHTGKAVTVLDTLSAMLFNVQGYFHEHLKADQAKQSRDGEPYAAPVKPVTYTNPKRGIELRLDGRTLREQLAGMNDPSDPTWGEINGSGNPEVGNYAAGTGDPESINVPIPDSDFAAYMNDLASNQKTSTSTTTNHTYILDPYLKVTFGPGSRRVYISGPMTGYPKHNFPAFDQAAEMFHDLHYEVENPADADRVNDTPGLVYNAAHYVKRDAEALIRSTHIAMLPGWERSKGAAAEFFLARWLGLTVLDATTGERFGTNANWTHLIEAAHKFLREQK